MEISGRTVLMLGGSGLVGHAVVRRLLPQGPGRIVIGALREEEAREAVETLREEAGGAETAWVAEWGDVFVRESNRARGRAELLADPVARAELLDDIFGPLEDAIARSTLVGQLERHRPHLVIDCFNTATGIAYQNLFESSSDLRDATSGGGVERPDVEAHLSTLYLPQLIRHVQLLLEGMRRAGTGAYVKIGTSGTGGMGLNVPFTHSEERPSRMLLAKASVAGAHSALLFLLARTPDAPAVIEIKPTAAIAWKSIGFGPILREGLPIPRYDASRPVPAERAFDGGGDVWEEVGEPLESVFLDAGENGLFALSEFETISALGMMEIVTPEEIAEAVLRELGGRSTGKNVVDALDASVFGPTYRGGVLREAALARMEALEREHGVRSVAFEMLGPPRLNKLLFEATLLERLFADLAGAAALDPADTAERAVALVEGDARLRTDILSVGIPILRPDGTLLRGRAVKVAPAPGVRPDVDRLAHLGWVDLRPACWVQWRDRCRRLDEILRTSPGVEEGSRSDIDVRAWSGRVRAGALAALVLREEEGGERTKR
ncbi:MAG: short-chain dehydrogenase [Gemmatimonadota bacterium]